MTRIVARSVARARRDVKSTAARCRLWDNALRGRPQKPPQRQRDGHLVAGRRLQRRTPRARAPEGIASPELDRSSARRRSRVSSHGGQSDRCRATRARCRRLRSTRANDQAVRARRERALDEVFRSRRASSSSHTSQAACQPARRSARASAASAGWSHSPPSRAHREALAVAVNVEPRRGPAARAPARPVDRGGAAGHRSIVDRDARLGSRRLARAGIERARGRGAGDAAAGRERDAHATRRSRASLRQPARRCIDAALPGDSSARSRSSRDASAARCPGGIRTVERVRSDRASRTAARVTRQRHAGRCRASRPNSSRLGHGHAPSMRSQPR